MPLISATLIWQIFSSEWVSGLIRLKAAGVYQLQLDDYGVTTTTPPGVRRGLAWVETTCLKETPDFYSVISADLKGKGKIYYIPKYSGAMDEAQYEQGMALFLSRIPTSAFNR